MTTLSDYDLSELICLACSHPVSSEARQAAVSGGVDVDLDGARWVRRSDGVEVHRCGTGINHCGGSVMARVHPLERKVARAESRAESAVDMFSVAHEQLTRAAEELEAAGTEHAGREAFHRQGRMDADMKAQAHRKAAGALAQLVPGLD